MVKEIEMSKMNDFMVKHRLENKLRLWETPGFFQFIEDLAEYMGPEVSLQSNVATMKKLYENQLKRIEEQDNKFKQGELDL